MSVVHECMLGWVDSSSSVLRQAHELVVLAEVHLPERGERVTSAALLLVVARPNLDSQMLCFVCLDVKGKDDQLLPAGTHESRLRPCEHAARSPSDTQMRYHAGALPDAGQLGVGVGAPHRDGGYAQSPY